jgi:DNA-binding transcriptional regulator YiaG
MNEEQYRAALERLKLTQAQAAELFNVNDRTSRRWALGETPVPTSVAMVLENMIEALERKPARARR